MTRPEIQELLEKPYNQNEWKNFIQSHFTNNKLYGEVQTIQLAQNPISKHSVTLGNYEVDDFTKIGIFEIQINDKVNITRNRVALRNILKDITAQVAGAMVVFVQGDKWRFSYISKRKVKNKNTNLIEDKETAPKRFTYLFGHNEKARTASDRFEKLINKQKDNMFQLLTLNDFEEAFSVEALSKDFFKKYKDTYEDFVEYLTGKRYKKQGNKFVEQNVNEPSVQLKELFKSEEPEKEARDFCKRMMGRIVFLYFIQKKGWLAVPKGKNWGEGSVSYLYDLFKNSNNEDDFYSKELVPLFFTTLNDLNSENEEKTLRFPYLNGGLFDNSLDEKYDNLKLPKHIFDTLFENFNNFNFTIHEDAPDEQTVAVDPEMLGHIFENLLEDNKDKGTFYTPKEIVHYMCKESLKKYLVSTINFNNYDDSIGISTIDKIIHQVEVTSEEKQFAEKNAYKIIDALENVKICDPAIGSGAFPMGLLQEIFNAQIYLQELKGFKKINEAGIKKHIIQESIYGVDLDAGAVDIARLRFWLSLVVDEEEPQPLPNLDFKIMQGNSLLGIHYSQGKDDEATKKFEDYKVKYFEENNPLKKKELKNKINFYTQKILETANDFSKYKIDFDYKLFFSEVFHGENSGFDIVIGNPPYLQIQKMGKDAIPLKNAEYKTFEKTGDLYSLFYELGNNILKTKGCLNYITSRQWINAGYGKSTRKFFAQETNPLQLIDFGKAKIFETATVFVNILLFEKSKNLNQLKACLCPDNFKVEEIDLSIFFENNNTDLNNITEDVWKIGEDANDTINSEIEQKGVKLKFWKNIDFNAGIKTGYNEAFHIPLKIRNELIAKNINNSEIIKPMLRGKDIKRYQYKFDETYMLFIPWHFPLQNDKSVTNASEVAEQAFINEYPDIYNHLYKYKKELSARNQTETGIRYEWYALQRYGADFWQNFEKEKIVWIEISDKANYTYDTNGMYLTNSAYFMSGDNLKYILGVLNSKTADFYFSQITAKIAGGRMRYTRQYVEQIPVPEISQSTQKPFEDLVDYLLYLNDKSKKSIIDHTSNERVASTIEEVLNMLVYELYFDEHMKENDIDVLQFIQTESIQKFSSDIQTAEIIKNFYLWFQKPENPIRQRMLLTETRSKDVIGIINQNY